MERTEQQTELECRQFDARSSDILTKPFGTVKIQVRETCAHCGGAGLEPHGPRLQACSGCGSAGYNERWVALEDLALSIELAAAIKRALEK